MLRYFYIISDNPLVLIDTSGCDCPELVMGEDLSKCNEGEAILTLCHIANLVKAGVSQFDIAVITPYNLQVFNSFIANHYENFNI